MFDLVLVALVTVSQAAEPSDVRLRVSGSGAWDVGCTFQTESGERNDSARGRV